MHPDHSKDQSTPKTQSDGLYAEIESLRRHGGDNHKLSPLQQSSASSPTGYLKGNGASARAPEPQAISALSSQGVGTNGRGCVSPGTGRGYTEIVISSLDKPELVSADYSQQRASLLQHAER